MVVRILYVRGRRCRSHDGGSTLSMIWNESTWSLSYTSVTGRFYMMPWVARIVSVFVRRWAYEIRGSCQIARLKFLDCGLPERALFFPYYLYLYHQ